MKERKVLITDSKNAPQTMVRTSGSDQKNSSNAPRTTIKIKTNEK